jgi:hypothetical protein
LALELLGVALFLFTGRTGTDFNYLAEGLVGLLWTLPNAVILYSQRAKFAQVETSKKVGRVSDGGES